jgi:hypothetical protein
VVGVESVGAEAPEVVTEVIVIMKYITLIGILQGIRQGLPDHKTSISGEPACSVETFFPRWAR